MNQDIQQFIDSLEALDSIATTNERPPDDEEVELDVEIGQHNTAEAIHRIHAEFRSTSFETSYIRDMMLITFSAIDHAGEVVGAVVGHVHVGDDALSSDQLKELGHRITGIVQPSNLLPAVVSGLQLVQKAEFEGDVAYLVSLLIWAGPIYMDVAKSAIADMVLNHGTDEHVVVHSVFGRNLIGEIKDGNYVENEDESSEL